MKKSLFDVGGRLRFLKTHWQSSPLFLKAAPVAIDDTLDRAALIELACRDDVESRLVLGSGKRWELRHGPFRRRDFSALPKRNWTLLVNGVENFVASARTLQTQLNFIPYARHDDVMISYAVPGGSVGAHFDSYDVFLLQGAGERRWRISAQRDLTLVERAPLKILKHFVPQQEWIAQHSDVLYLPPRYAHHGVALTECITWSVGMRAPSRQEMTSRFLDYLQDHLQIEGGYHDRGLRHQQHPSIIHPDMLKQVEAMLKALRWNKADVARALGEYLTEPKANIVFDRNDVNDADGAALTAARFARMAVKHGVVLSLKSRMLFHGMTLFINGESERVTIAERKTLMPLADQRALPPQAKLSSRLLDMLYQWYRAGYVDVMHSAETTS